MRLGESGPPDCKSQILLCLQLDSKGLSLSSDGPTPGRLIYRNGFLSLKVDVGLYWGCFQLILEAVNLGLHVASCH